jgi:hypothetical protein
MGKARDLARQPNAIVTDSNGRVGIGTSSPTSLLHLSSSLPILTFTDTDDSATTRIYQDNAAFVIEVDGADTKPGSSLRFQVDNTTRMTIDSAGRVTTPSQPAFSVRKTNGTSTQGSGIIVFNAVDTNTGSHYNSTNGRFTAPISGRYFFSFSGSATVTADFEIFINGGRVQEYHAYAAGSNVTGTVNAILTLSANDYVQIQSVNNYRADNHTMWCGYLVG